MEDNIPEPPLTGVRFATDEDSSLQNMARAAAFAQAPRRPNSSQQSTFQDLPQALDLADAVRCCSCSPCLHCLYLQTRQQSERPSPNSEVTAVRPCPILSAIPQKV